MQSESTTAYLLMQSKNEEQQERAEDTTLQTMNAAQAGTSQPGEMKQQSKLFLGPKKSLATCPHCGARVRTTIKHTTTTRTHLVAALCCTCCCLSCIPYCMDSTRNTDHYCPNCSNYMGSYKK